MGAVRGEKIEPNVERRRVLRSAGIGTPYRLYQAKTFLYSTLAAVGGVVLGGYAAGALIEFLGIDRLNAPIAGNIFRPLPDWLVSFDAKYFALLFVGALLLGGGAAGLVYVVRWNIPSVRADTRRRQIDAGMPRMIAFVYALSRGGMSFPAVMRTLSDNSDVFGTGAEEMGIGVRNIDLFGDDLVSSIRDLATRTPSEQFQSFAENLTSVLQSGQELSGFLRDEYERYRDAAEEQQQEILDVLATASEIYVTVVVAGMLFLITILLIIGLTSGGMLRLLQLITYVVLPATNVLFIAYLSEVTQPLRATRNSRPDEADPSDGGPGSPVATDGGEALLGARTRENVARLRVHRRLARFQRVFTDPGRVLLDKPSLLLYATVPLALLFVAVQFPTYYADGAFDVRALDDVVIQAALFVLATFGVVYEVSRRRLERLEGAVPDLLDRLASLNEAGLSVVSSFDRVRRSDIGALDEEVDRIWRDIQWGATVEEALERFEKRVRTPSVTRIVTLLTNSMRASNEIGPVLRIAAEQARADRKLKRQRRQETMTYLVVIYVSFLVFLVVIGAIDTVLIPNLPTGAETSGASGIGGPFGGIGDVAKADYQLVFFHAGIIQAALSGLVGGQMAGGSLKDGLKHASVMLLVAYLAFLVSQDLSLSGSFAAGPVGLL
ncbi:type II secretion system F family protein [Halosegnis marinus]|uniref:type II secretion system F family protein n=1 Tax=Halosegnis marinus TaxID=3034023 RepID=UPI0036061AC1